MADERKKAQNHIDKPLYFMNKYFHLYNKTRKICYIAILLCIVCVCVLGEIDVPLFCQRSFVQIIVFFFAENYRFSSVVIQCYL